MAKTNVRTVPDMRGYVSPNVFDGVKVLTGSAADAQISRTLRAVRAAEDAARHLQPLLRRA